MNDVCLQGAEHHNAVEALRSSGVTVTMTVLRERMVEPENAITTTPLRPEDDYFPRERRASGVPFCMEPGSPVPNPNTYRLTTCLLRNDKGLGFSIAGGKGSTPYRTGDTVSATFVKFGFLADIREGVVCKYGVCVYLSPSVVSVVIHPVTSPVQGKCHCVEACHGLPHDKYFRV